MKGFVHILKDEQGRFYVGSTSNLEQRVKQHRYGSGGKTTRGMMSPKVVLPQNFDSMILARKLKEE